MRKENKAAIYLGQIEVTHSEKKSVGVLASGACNRGSLGC